MEKKMKIARLLFVSVVLPILTAVAQPASGRSTAGGLISPGAKASAMVPYLNGTMKIDSLWESLRVIRDDDKSLLLVHSEVPNLIFESNRKIIKADQKS
jgi:hypothetical protein